MPASNAEPPPGAAALAADTTIGAATLCGSLARTAQPGWPDARGVTTQAAHLVMRAVAARKANATAYGHARRELATAPGSETGRDAMLRAALLSTVETLLALTEIAADTAIVAAEIAIHVSADLRPDALGAAELAFGAARATADLLSINLALPASDPRREQVATLVAAARSSAETARAALLD